MAKKNRAGAGDEKRDAAAYYRLNLRAVEDLVTANEENSPQVSREELRKYRSGPRISLSDWARAIVIKAWFAGAICFFFIWGLGYYIGNQLDQIVVVTLALGTATDLLTNNAMRFLAKTPHANDRFMMFPKKGFVTLPLNILYAGLLVFCVVMTYQTINVALIALTGAENTVPLGVGPILFGVFITAWDLLFIRIKHTFLAIAADARKKAAQGAAENTRR